RAALGRGTVRRRALAGLRLLPVLAQELALPHVVPAAVLIELLPLDPGLRVAGLLERAPRALVLHVRLRLELVEVELAKGVARAQRHGLAGEALPPERLLADRDAGRAVAVQPVDLADSRRADRL